MSLWNGPPRGGSRGGKDQFSWEDVKGDKDREYYLGHSVKALTGRWQKGKDVYWYTRDKKVEDDVAQQDEIRAVKEREEQLMAEALGLKPKAAATTLSSRLDAQDVSKLMSRAPQGEADSDSEPAQGLGRRGVGFGPRALGGVAATTVLEGYNDTGVSGEAGERGVGGHASTGDTTSRQARSADVSDWNGIRGDGDGHGEGSRRAKRERSPNGSHRKRKKRSKEERREKKRDKKSKHARRERRSPSPRRDRESPKGVL